MSVQDDLKKAGINLTASQKRQIKDKVLQLKIKRRLLEKQMDGVVKRARLEGREAKKGQLTKAERRFIGSRMEARSTLSRQIFRLGGERKAPDYDPY